jgi:hypothetical protein
MEEKMFKWVVLAVAIVLLCVVGWYVTTQVDRYAGAMKQKAMSEGAMGAVRGVLPFGQFGKGS